MSDTDQNANGSGGQEGANGNANGTGDNKNGQGSGTGDGNGQGQGTDGGNKPPENIPYSRFSEEVSKRKALEDKLAKVEADKEAERLKSLADNSEYQKLYDEAKPHVERAKALEAVVAKSVDELMTKIPEDKRSLIPETLAPEAKLDYIHKNFEFLTGKTGKETIGHGTNPGTDTSSTKVFTAEELKDPKFYQANRDEILKAQREGRIKD